MPVDASKLDLIEAQDRLWFAVNWLFLLIPIHSFWMLLSFNDIKIQFLTVILGFIAIRNGIGIFPSFLAGSNTERNLHTANSIIDEAGDHAEGCLVIGAEHHEEVATFIERCKPINVINPRTNTVTTGV